MFSSLFLNKVVPCKTWNKSRDLVSKSPEAVKLVETELEFMYDVSYTKARMFCSGPGILIRVATFISLVTTLVIFTILVPSEKAIIWYSLVIGAILVEVCSFIILSTLDWPKLWWTLPNVYPGKLTGPNSCTSMQLEIFFF